MQIDKRNRSDLKKWFVKNAIPTESNFAELIDGMLNQKDDGVVKLPNDALSIEAAGDATSQKKAIHFYNSFGDNDPTWVLSLNPRQNPADANTARAGLSIGNSAGASRLFIDRDTGNVGIRTINPLSTLTVGGPNASLRIAAPNEHGYAFENDNTDGNKLKLRYRNPTNVASQLMTFDAVNGGVEVSAKRIKLGLEGNGGGQLTLVNNPNDNKIYIEAFSADGTGHAAELLLTGRFGQPVPELSLVADKIKLSGKVGLGTTAPRARLDVPQGDVYVGPSLNISAPSTGVNAGILNIFNETNNKFWHITLRSGEEDKLIFWRNNAVNYQAVMRLTMDGIVEAPNGALVHAIGIGTQVHGNVTWPYETIQMHPGNNLRIWFGATERFVLWNSGGISGGETTTGWSLGRGAWGPDNWLRITAAHLGNVYHDLAINSLWSAGAKRFDLAEVTEAYADDRLEQGDVVVIDREHGTRVRRSRRPHDPAVYGIVSSYQQAAFVIGGFGGPEQMAQARDKLPIALVGRVQVKVTAEAGPIRVGDLLTSSSTPGHAMRCADPAAHPGAIAGKALEPLAEGTGMITALVTLQ